MTDALAISLEHLADNKRASDEQHAADMAEMDAERAALNKRVADLTALIAAQHGDVVVRTAKLLYEKDDMIAAAEADNATLKREIATLREALDAFGRSAVRDRVATAVGCNHDLLHDALQSEVRRARYALSQGGK